jgi:hypothetical protein
MADRRPAPGLRFDARVRGAVSFGVLTRTQLTMFCSYSELGPLRRRYRCI